MEIQLVADTNLFFECKALEQLPWHELGCDPVVILLTKPVVDEIDKHKKANGRTRDRALDIFSRIRDMLDQKVSELDIFASNPRVVLRRAQGAKPDPELADELDYSKTDKRLVGIVANLTKENPTGSAALFTDDTGPAMLADGLGVPYRMIDPSWRRPAAESTEQKKIKDLEKDLATYRAQEPRIVVAGGNFKIGDEITVERKVAAPLTTAEIEAVLASLRLKHPVVSEFTVPPPKITTDLAGEQTRIDYSRPPDEEMVDYRDVRYPQWIEACRDVLKKLHEGRDVLEDAIVLQWTMSNQGSRPAHKARVEFVARGPVLLQRLSDDDEDEDAIPKPAKSTTPPTARFPAPPRPPGFREQVTITAPLPKPRAAQGLDIASLRRPSILGEGYTDLAKLTDGLGMTGVAGLGRHMQSLGLPDNIFRQHADLLKPYGVDALYGRHAFATSVPTIDPVIFRPPPAPNPEAFYYDHWSKLVPVEVGGLTCSLWRHQTGKQGFEFKVLFDAEGDAHGVIECAVHAENLTKPVEAKVRVRRTVTQLSVVDVANALVDSCN